jgi:LDH2 family malate/lactate/ureidoglycolate dehydrogenase
MDLTIDQARQLSVRALTRHGMRSEHAAQVAEHLIDAALCGHEFSSLPRIVAIVEELRNKAPAGELRVTHEDGPFAHIDGADNIGYVVALAAVDKAIAIAQRHGVAVVTANNTWFSGRCSFYVERAARADLVAMHATNTTARVALFGGTDRFMGTNPFSIAFPGDDQPLVIDIGTSAITWGDVVLLGAKGEPLPEDVAVDQAGAPTRDPGAALEGAFLPWGGQRGSALALAVQMLGVLAGSRIVIQDTSNYGLIFVVLDPRRMAFGCNLKAQVAEMRRMVERGRPMHGVGNVRVPGDGSQNRRERARRAATIWLDDTVYERILALT